MGSIFLKRIFSVTYLAKQSNLTTLLGITYVVGQNKQFRFLFHGPKWLSKVILGVGEIDGI